MRKNLKICSTLFIIIVINLAAADEKINQLNEFKDQDKILCIKALLNKELLASGLENGVINIWNLTSNTITKSLRNHTGSIRTFELLNDGTLVSGSSDLTIKLWNTIIWQLIRTLQSHDSTVTCIKAFKNEILISGSDDNTIKIWNLTNGQVIKKLYGHNDPKLPVQQMDFIRILISQVTCILVLNDEILASGYEDKIIRLFNITTGQVINELNGHNNWIYGLVFTSDNSKIISASTDSYIFIWEFATGYL